MKLYSYKQFILTNLTKISDRLNRMKTRTVVFLFLLVHLIFNYKDAKQGFINGWNEATEKRETIIENQ
jgi:hypothetical protein